MRSQHVSWLLLILMTVVSVSCGSDKNGIHRGDIPKCGDDEKYSFDQKAVSCVKLTDLEKRYRDLTVEFWNTEDDAASGWLRQRGVKAMIPKNASAENCDRQFPVLGIRAGLYFLPQDELYNNPDVRMDGYLCFATPGDAELVGYRRGPR